MHISLVDVLLALGVVVFGVLALESNLRAYRLTARLDKVWEHFQDYILIGLLSDYRVYGRESIADRYRALFGKNVTGLENLLNALQRLDERMPKPTLGSAGRKDT